MRGAARRASRSTGPAADLSEGILQNEGDTNSDYELLFEVYFYAGIIGAGLQEIIFSLTCIPHSVNVCEVLAEPMARTTSGTPPPQAQRLRRPKPAPRAPGRTSRHHCTEMQRHGNLQLPRNEKLFRHVRYVLPMRSNSNDLTKYSGMSVVDRLLRIHDDWIRLQQMRRGTPGEANRVGWRSHRHRRRSRQPSRSRSGRASRDAFCPLLSIAGYLCSFTSRHFDSSHRRSSFAVWVFHGHIVARSSGPQLLDGGSGRRRHHPRASATRVRLPRIAAIDNVEIPLRPR